jgi:hypothetical protein
LQPLAKVSEHPNILNLDATYKDEDFVDILCEVCHGTRLFSIAEVQVIVRNLEAASTSVAVRSTLLPKAKYTAFLLLRSAPPAAMLPKQGLGLQGFAIAASLVTLSGSGIALVLLQVSIRTARCLSNFVAK